MPLADRGNQLLDLLSIEGLGPPHVAGRGGATPGEKPSTPAAASASKPMSGAPRRWACFPGEIPRKVLRTCAATFLNGPAASTARIATRRAMAARIPTMAKAGAWCAVARGSTIANARVAPTASTAVPATAPSISAFGCCVFPPSLELLATAALISVFLVYCLSDAPRSGARREKFSRPTFAGLSLARRGNFRSRAERAQNQCRTLL